MSGERISSHQKDAEKVEKGAGRQLDLPRSQLFSPSKKAIFVTDLHVGFDKLVWSNEEKRKCVRSGWQLTKLC